MTCNIVLREDTYKLLEQIYRKLLEVAPRLQGWKPNVVNDDLIRNGYETNTFKSGKKTIEMGML